MTTGSRVLGFEVSDYPVCKIRYSFWKRVPEQNCGTASQLAFELPRVLPGNQQCSLPRSQVLDFPRHHIWFSHHLHFRWRNKLRKFSLSTSLMNTGGGFWTRQNLPDFASAVLRNARAVATTWPTRSSSSWSWGRQELMSNDFPKPADPFAQQLRKFSLGNKYLSAHRFLL